MNTSRFIFVFVGIIMQPSLLWAATYDSTIKFANRMVLSVPVSGQIKHVKVVPGQQVKAGDVLVALDKVPFEAAVSQARADLVTKKTMQEEAKRDYDQVRELYDRGVSSTVELENARNHHLRQEAALSAAQAVLTQASHNLKHSRIVAPVDGLILKVNARVNESINNENEYVPLIVFAEASLYKAYATVPLDAVRSLKLGQSGKVVVDGKNFKGTVTSISFEPDVEKNNAYPVEIEFSSGNTLLQGGQTAKVEF